MDALSKIKQVSKDDLHRFLASDRRDLQEAFYRGLFWIALALLLISWILSGS